MRAFVWTYQVKPDHAADFRRAYASTGDWALLFAKSPDYKGTKLLSDPGDPCRFMTIDYFLTPDSRPRFLAENRTLYETLDRKWQDATVSESFIGEFEVED